MAAIVVALMVVKIGLNLIFDSIKELVDTSLPPKLVAEIRTTIMSIDGVEGIHLLRTRQMGEDALIDAHIVVDPRITVSEGHAIGDSVRDELISRFDDIWMYLFMLTLKMMRFCLNKVNHLPAKMFRFCWIVTCWIMN